MARIPHLDKLRFSVLRHSIGTRLGRNTLWSMLGLGSRLVIQALYFVIIARKLGAQNYGAFVGVVAIAALFAPFASWGSGNILVKYVARDRSSFARYWGSAVATCLTSGVVLVAVSVFLSALVFTRSISLWIPVLVCVSDLLFARLTDISVFAFQSIERLRMVAFIQASSTALRLLAAVVLLLFFQTPSSAVDWAFFYAASTGLCALVALYLVRRQIGWGPVSLSPMRGHVREGFHFAVGWAAQGAYNDIDKTMVGRIDSLSAAGFYSAAYRIEDALFAPIRAMLQASYARFFKAGASGIDGSARLARRLLPWAMAYGLGASVFLYLISPVLPSIFGPGYQDVAVALRWIAVLPLLRSASYLAGYVLAGADRQPVRSAFQIGIAVLNFGLNLVLIPRFGWVAAAWTSLASDGLCALGLWGVVMWLVARSRKAEAARTA